MSLKERFTLTFDKDLGRVDYFINQLICALFTFAFTMLGYMCLPAAALAFTKGSLDMIFFIPVVGACIIAVTYFVLLSLCNTQGRFNNLAVSSRVVAWIIYLLIGFSSYTAWLRYILYFLPPGFLRKKA